MNCPGYTLEPPRVLLKISMYETHSRPFKLNLWWLVQVEFFLIP